MITEHPRCPFCNSVMEDHERLHDGNHMTATEVIDAAASVFVGRNSGWPHAFTDVAQRNIRARATRAVATLISSCLPYYSRRKP